MSTAFYPTNMRQQPAGGYNSKSTLQDIPYRPWKGTGLFSNPVGVTATHIRPLTNLDPGNIFPTGFGLARPIKHYRKGTVIPIHFAALNVNPNNTAETVEKGLIEYNVNRAVKSSLGSSLGGGNGGTGLISQMIDMPGSFIVKDNGTNNLGEGLDYTVATNVNGDKIDAECKNCNGVGIVSSWYPINNLNEKPEPTVTNPPLCCNQQRKAIQRVLPTNTNVKQNYYQTTYMYLYHRCQTFKQRQFNFIRGSLDQNILDLFLSYPFVTAKILTYTKPGDPLSITNYYVAQCNPNFIIENAVEINFFAQLSKFLLDAKLISPEEYNILIARQIQSTPGFLNALQNILNYQQVIEYLYQIAANPYNSPILCEPYGKKGCGKVIYKPNNPQYAQQGGVSSSTRILKLNVDTISTAAARRRSLGGYNTNTATALAFGEKPQNPFIYKDKVPPCQPQTYIGNPFFFSGQHQNKLICRTNSNGAEYHTYNTINSGSAGNYIGATQSGGAGYRNKDQIPNTTYFDNIQNSLLKNINFNLISV